jgi:outer membrane protein assembly factor BamB
MARIASGLVYIGIKGNVVALDRRSGAEVWRAGLKGSMGRSSSFVCVFRDGDLLFATCGGEIYCLDPTDGTLLWQNPLKGLGLGLTSIAGEPGSSTSNLTSIVAAEVKRQAAQHSAAAAAG